MRTQERMLPVRRPSAASRQLTIESLAQAADLHVEAVRRIVAYGLLEPAGSEQDVAWFDPQALRRLRSIQRLREDLGINLAGVAVVLELVDRIAGLQRELAAWQRK